MFLSWIVDGSQLSAPLPSSPVLVIKVGPFLRYIFSGVIAPSDAGPIGELYEEETVAALEKLQGFLRDAGLCLDVLTRIHIKVATGRYSVINRVSDAYAKFLQGRVEVMPARSCVGVAGLPKGALVEMIPDDVWKVAS